MPVIETSELRKTYAGVEALRGVSLSVESGQIFGLLGQNGAGKSTLVKILLGIVRPTDGEAFLLGKPAGIAETRKRVGYLPEDHQFPGYHTANTLLDIYGQLLGVPRAERIKRVAESLEIVGLNKRADSKIRTYSKGMKQRLGIAQSFFHDPEVIFLDEPTDGVDPVGRKEIRDLLIQLKGEGRTIFFNSHLLSEVEMISDRVAIMHQGQLVRQGTVADLTRQEGRFVIGLVAGQTLPTEELGRMGYRTESVDGQWEIIVGEDTSAIDKVVRYLIEKGLSIRHLIEKKQTLEDVFVTVVESNKTGGEARRARAARPVVGKTDSRRYQ